MPKNVVFCADGTWNRPKDPSNPQGDDLLDHQKRDTNVAKLAGHNGVPALLASSASQVVIYEDGVGVEFPKVLGGAFGVGVFGKVKQGYAQIAEKYEKGDRVSVFGFSRGAYIARCLAGMLSLIGLPETLPAGDRKEESKKLAEKAFVAYALRFGNDIVMKFLAEVTPDMPKVEGLQDDLQKYGLHPPTIAMQGVWDTVGATGFTGALFGIVDPLVYGFLNTDLHPNTKAAFHAMSIDEHRGSFTLTPWKGTVADGQILKQVWFAGVHSEVGGSADAVGLSDITLSWMLANAEACGLELTAEAQTYRSIDPVKALEPSKDSFSPLWVISKHRSIPARSTIANSVAIRLRMDATYRPTNLSLDQNGQLDAGYAIETVVGPLQPGTGIVVPSNTPEFDTGFDVEAGKSYHFIASGTWVDKNPPGLDANGVAKPGGIRDKMDHFKRKPDAPWMALLGRIDQGDWFVIGKDSTQTFAKKGRLFCCANDVPHFYGNNHGSVILRIS